MFLLELPGQCDVCKEVLVHTDHVQQDSFYPISTNMEIQMIWHLRRIVPRPGVYFIPERKKALLTLRRRIKSHLLFAGIIRSSPFSPR